MIYDNLSDYEKLRFNQSDFCPICKRVIKRTDQVSLMKTRYGKSIIYSFFHLSCIIDSATDFYYGGDNYAEEEQKA